MRLCILLISIVICSYIRGQSDIQGTIDINFQDAGLVCGNTGRKIDIFADLTGLQGVGGSAIFNAWQLNIDIDRPQAFAHVIAGTSPVLCNIVYSDRSLLNPEIRIIGFKAISQVTTSRYHLCSIYLAGDEGPVNLSINGGSSFGSAVRNGFGPAPIDFDTPSYLTVIPSDQTILLTDALAHWLLGAPDFDFAMPIGLIEVRDLVEMVNCKTVIIGGIK